MTHKTIRDFALIILVVFALTIVAYPLIFGTDPHPKGEPMVGLGLAK